MAGLHRVAGSVSCNPALGTGAGRQVGRALVATPQLSSNKGDSDMPCSVEQGSKPC